MSFVGALKHDGEITLKKYLAMTFIVDNKNSRNDTLAGKNRADAHIFNFANRQDVLIVTTSKPK